jgi:hypothetical protein
MCQPDHVAAATLMAAEYLIREADPAKLDAFLVSRSARDRAAIYQQLEKHKAKRRREATP